MTFISHFIEKDFADVTRDDIDLILPEIHTSYKTIKSKETITREIKYIWKTLFPEKDEKGRIDDTLVPYDVRHLSPKIDRSREKSAL